MSVASVRQALALTYADATCACTLMLECWKMLSDVKSLGAGKVSTKVRRKLLSSA